VLAAALAPSIGAIPGAVVIRSDEIRKQLCGVDPLQRLGPEGYTSDVTQRVYATMMERAVSVVRAGYAAIADAVFARPSDREAIEQAAATEGLPFVGIWLDAPPDVLVARAAQRHHDPSDADANVIGRQLAADTGPLLWHRVDASSGIDHVLRQATALIEARDSPRAV
jgi:predicted kinase